MESKASKASRVEDLQGWMKQPTEKSSGGGGGHTHQNLATVAEQLEFRLGVGADDTNTSYGLQ